MESVTVQYGMERVRGDCGRERGREGDNYSHGIERAILSNL